MTHEQRLELTHIAITTADGRYVYRHPAAVGADILRSLERAGYIEKPEGVDDKGRDWLRGYFRVTPAGKAALEAEGAR